MSNPTLNNENIVADWIKSRGTSMNGEAYAAAVDLVTYALNIRAALATSASALARDEASVLTDEQIVRSGYMHTTEDDEPLFQFDRKELIAMVRELLAASSAATVSDAAGVGLSEDQMTELYHRAQVQSRTHWIENARVILGEAATTAGAQDEREALRDMLESTRAEMEMLREALGVEVEPHQSLLERMLEAARAASSATAPLTSDSDAVRLASAVDLMKRIKRDLMHARRFGSDTLAAYRRACSSAEGDVEEWLIEHARATSRPPGDSDAQEFVKLYRDGDVYRARKSDAAGIAELQAEGWEIARAQSTDGEPK